MKRDFQFNWGGLFIQESTLPSGPEYDQPCTTAVSLDNKTNIIASVWSRMLPDPR